MTENNANAPISTATMVEPTGVEYIIEIRMPSSAQNTDNIAEQIVTDLKLLNILIAESAGKIISADIKREPTRFIASTIMTAIIIAMSRLYIPAFVPEALAKFSSNVTAKILL